MVSLSRLVAAPWQPRGGRTLLAFGIILIALNLRMGIGALAPLLDRVNSDLELSALEISLLPALPPLMFGVIGLLAARFIPRVGLAVSVQVGLITLIAGTLLRLGPTPFTLLGGTLLIGGGLALLNVVVPTLVQRWFPDRIGPMTALYSLAFSLGSTLAAGLTLPIADLAGGSWRWGLGLWVVPALAAWLLWGPVRRQALRWRAEADDPEIATPPALVRVTLWRNPLAWAITGMFTIQSLSAYAIFGWWVIVFIDAGIPEHQAGLLLALMSLISVPGSFLLPRWAARSRDQRWWFLGVNLTLGVGYLGLMVAPGAYPVAWSIIVGVGLGTLPLILLTYGLRTRTPAETTALSSMSQGLGYLLSTPLVVIFGLLHTSSGGWTLPFLMLALSMIPQLWLGFIVGRVGYVQVDSGRAGSGKAGAGQADSGRAGR